jgi:hypothetical protein
MEKCLKEVVSKMNNKNDTQQRKNLKLIDEIIFKELFEELFEVFQVN